MFRVFKVSQQFPELDIKDIYQRHPKQQVREKKKKPLNYNKVVAIDFHGWIFWG